MQKLLTARTAERLAAIANSPPPINAVVGLDAFVDEIIHVVDKRMSVDSFTIIQQISDLGTRIVDAAGRSTNLELVVERVKLGGNGPIMANALSALGPAVTCVGPLGEPDLHPAFAEIAARARIVTLGNPAHTDALEFEDGKLMIGKLETLNDITWDHIVERIGQEELVTLFLKSEFVALVNWTMLPHMTEIWRCLLDLLKTSPKTSGTYFFDLADPEKRGDAAIAEACLLLAQYNQYRRTILGLNEKEAFLVGKALGYSGTGHSTRQDVVNVACYISTALPIETVVVHPRAYAVVASKGQLTANVDGPFTDNPLISTGAGDHFNAGFSLGKCFGLSDEEAATAAVGTSGYYVRNAASPSLSQLAGFLQSLAGE